MSTETAPWIAEHRRPREAEVAAYVSQFRGIRGLWRSRGSVKRLERAAAETAGSLAALTGSVAALNESLAELTKPSPVPGSTEGANR